MLEKQLSVLLVVIPNSSGSTMAYRLTYFLTLKQVLEIRCVRKEAALVILHIFCVHLFQ